MMSPVIWVEGILAAGKTTYAEEMERRLGFKCVKESEDNINVNCYLESFYKDPKAYAFTIQTYFLIQRYAVKVAYGLEAARGAYKGVIVDRSIMGDMAFARHNHKIGNMHDLDWMCYQDCFNILTHSFLPPTVLVYLEVSPSVAFGRMKQRGRPAELTVPIEYLIGLAEEYECIIQEVESGNCPWLHSVRVWRIPYDQQRDWVEEENRLRGILNIR